MGDAVARFSRNKTPRKSEAIVARKKSLAFSIKRIVGNSQVVLLLSGPVDVEASAVLGPACARILESERQVILDLSDVNSADGVGLRLLISLQHIGVILANVPASIAHKIAVLQSLPAKP